MSARSSVFNGLFSIIYDEKEWKPEYNFVDFTEAVYSVNILDKNYAWLGGDNQVYSFAIDSMGEPNNLKSYSVTTDFPEQYRLDYINDSLYLFLESGFYYFDQKADSFKLYHPSFFDSQSRIKFLLNQQSYPWIRLNREWICLNAKATWSNQEKSILKLFDDISAILSDSKKDLWIINNNNELYKIDHSKFKELRPDFNIFFNHIKN